MEKQLSKTHSYDFKKRIVEKYFEGYAVRDLLKEYQLKKRTVYDWITLVKEGGYEALYDRRGRKNRKNEKEHYLTENERLRLENEYLKKLLDLKKG